MPSIPKIAIIIPAAGASRRFGSPKQLLKWGNTTLIGNTINRARELQQDHIFVVLGANYEAIEREVQNEPVVIVNSPEWQNGLGTSIAAGVKQLLSEKHHFDAILVLLADQPLVSVAYLKEMIGQFEPNKGQIIATSYREKRMGVPALFDQKYFSALSQLTHDKGAKDIIMNNIESVIVVPTKPILTDIDTREDYENLIKTNPQ